MDIPKEVKFVLTELKKHKFEAYIVGGCVRDYLRGEVPEDWDVTTNAKPKEISKVFPKNFSDNKFGTVTALVDKMEIEITPYRIESKYTDKRHPDKVEWVENIEEDLKRRDFTVNAMAATLESKSKKLKVIDLFNGQKDLEKKIIKAVGKAEERFEEDALRLMRAVRFTATLGEEWKIEKETEKAIKNNAGLLQVISKERIRDEFMKIIMSDKPDDGIEVLRKLGLLKYVAPELEEGYKVGQNKHHIYNIYEHSLLSLKYAAKKKFNKYVRLAALFHDIGKPKAKRGDGPDSTFYNHEIIGAKMAVRILERLRFSKKDLEKTVKLVRYHLFYYNVDEVGESSVRRLVRQVGPENMEELLQVRFCDRIGSGVPKAEPYKLRHLKYIIEKVSQDPISVTMIKISGNDIMKILNIKPGMKVGAILDILLNQVLEDPKKNKKDFLEKEVKKLNKLSDSELYSLSKKAKTERQKLEMKQDKMTKKKYWVT